MGSQRFGTRDSMSNRREEEISDIYFEHCAVIMCVLNDGSSE